jgi:DNA-binding NarL/FixJ family response regulator
VPFTYRGGVDGTAREGGAGVDVLVVEGSAVLRERLVWHMADVPGVSTAVGVEPAQALARLGAGRVDAIVVDADDAGWPDLAALRALRRAAPGALVAVLAAEACPELRDRCTAAGADLCLSRSDDLAAVDDALRALAARRPAAPAAGTASRA